ncbi:ABC transporter substrate-binding protein [Streptomyces sp. NPDC001312]|uniref:ABC transporter substrate-binding protein n=1 Tax=Streptomyces sp. NPDC001312 TaxID=3364561 RepID=UPI00367737D7
MNKQLTGRVRLRAALAGAVAVLVATSLTGCASHDAKGSTGSHAAKNAEAVKRLPKAIADAGVVRVASTFGYPPEQFYEEDGTTPTGFSVELGHALGEQLGVDFKFENVSFDAILPGIEAKRYDIAISSMSITPERSQQVNFVKYMDAGGSLLVKGDNNDISGMQDLCGKTAANTTGSLHGAYLEEYSKTNCVAQGKPPIKVVNFSDAAAPNQAVATGRADVCYRDFTANAYIAQKSNGQFKVVGGIVKTSPYGIAVGKDDLQLAEAINVALNAIIKDGTYDKILSKWKVDEAAITQSEVVKATA